MATSSIFQRFITALKRHWREALPNLQPLRERRGPLPKSSSFDAGVIPGSGQRVYLEFQTTSKEAGRFTINLVVVDKGRQVSCVYVLGNDRKPGNRLGHGGHRIGHFLGDGRHDKWWHLCGIRDDLMGDEPDWRELELSFRKGSWSAASYDDETQVIDAAVTDVTRDVVRALHAIGIPATGGA